MQLLSTSRSARPLCVTVFFPFYVLPSRLKALHIEAVTPGRERTALLHAEHESCRYAEAPAVEGAMHVS